MLFHRQRVLLFFLSRAGRSVSRIEMMKWCFLLRMETDTQGGDGFYEFFPYQHGPFSFCLYRDIDRLIDQGLLAEIDDRHWEATATSARAAASVVEGVRRDADRVLLRHRKKSTGRLLSFVYQEYPSYTFGSRRPQVVRPKSAPTVFTVGYERLSVDGLLNTLLQNGIERVIDVRKNAVARRYGFHKSTLDRLCGRVGLDYAHTPELGIESAQRQDLRTSRDYQELFDRYESSTLLVQSETLSRVAAMVREKASALLCFERDANCCHRSRVADAVAEMTGLPTNHVRPYTDESP